MATNSKLQSVENSCELIITSVRDSLLNFSLQETPFSIYITIRKSLAKNKLFSQDSDQIHLQNKQQNKIGEDKKELLEKEIVKLKMMLKTSEDANLILKKNYEEAVDDCEQCYKQIKDLETKIEGYEQKIVIKDEISLSNQKSENLIKKLKDDNAKLEGDLEDVEKKWKVLNKLVKVKEKEIHDLEKENSNLSDNLLQMKTKFTNLTANVNREKKQEEKKLKKQERKEFMENLKAETCILNFGCDKCNLKFETLSKLVNHERMLHMKNNSSQTDVRIMEDKVVQYNNCEFICDKSNQTHEEKTSVDEVEYCFKKYLCYYCDKNIDSEQQLSEHRKNCRGSNRMFCAAPVGLSRGFPVGFPPLHSVSAFRPGSFSLGFKF